MCFEADNQLQKQADISHSRIDRHCTFTWSSFHSRHRYLQSAAGQSCNSGVLSCLNWRQIGGRTNEISETFPTLHAQRRPMHRYHGMVWIVVRTLSNYSYLSSRTEYFIRFCHQRTIPILSHLQYLSKTDIWTLIRNDEIRHERLKLSSSSFFALLT